MIVSVTVETMVNRLQRSLHAAIFGALMSMAARAQQPAAQAGAAFETASVRPSHVTASCFSMLPPGSTHYDLTCVSLRFLIALAYNGSTSHIEGGGNALESLYDLRATTPDEIPWTAESVLPMLRQFLAERFHLVVHTGKREIAGYGLAVAKGGPKLHAVAAESVVQGHKAGEPSQNFTYPGHAQGRGLNSDGIASLLAMVLQAPVVDHTGISGLYNVDLSYAPDNAPDSSLPSLFTAVEEQLGLKLKPEKVMVDTIVVDHADDAPTPN